MFVEIDYEKKSLDQQSKRHKVRFSIEAPGAARVVLMGDFNNWDPNMHPMKNDGYGIWTKSVSIPPGKYEYKFLIDSEWKEDPVNEKTCPNCFGSDNSVLDLELK